MDRKGREVFDFSDTGVLNILSLVHSSDHYDTEESNFKTPETCFECGKIFLSLNNLCYEYTLPMLYIYYTGKSGFVIC